VRQAVLRELAHHAGVGAVYTRASERFAHHELQAGLQALGAEPAWPAQEEHVIEGSHACGLVSYTAWLLQRERGQQERPRRGRAPAQAQAPPAAGQAQQAADQQQPAEQQQRPAESPPQHQQHQHQQWQQMPELLSVLVISDLPLTFGPESAACTSAITACLRLLARCGLLRGLQLRWSRRSFFEIMRQGGKQLERMAALWGRALAALRGLLQVRWLAVWLAIWLPGWLVAAAASAAGRRWCWCRPRRVHDARAEGCATALRVSRTWPWPWLWLWPRLRPHCCCCCCCFFSSSP
jgi:hypothetical protein